MKRLVCLLVVIVCCFTALAQVAIIPKVGATLSTIAWDDDEEVSTKSRLGYTFGIGVNVQLSEMFSFQPELVYIQKGYKADASFEQTTGTDVFKITATNEMNVDYLEMPMLGKVVFGEGGMFFMTLGPSVAFGVGGKNKVKARITYTSGGMTDSFSFSETGKIKFEDQPDDADPESVDAYIDNRFEVALQFGAGITIKELVTFDVRYGLGLTDISSEQSSKNRVVQFTLGIPIKLR